MKTVNIVDLKHSLAQDSVLLIDVREPFEYQEEHIQQSLLIPLGEISHEKLPSRDKPIVIYCRSGKRSVTACLKLLEGDPRLDVASLGGGILAWKEAGFEVEKSKDLNLPLDRQTQIASGGLALSGFVLGTWIHSGFHWLSGFVGLGLVFAGLSGWCGMAKLLAKMPWNA